MTKQMDQNRARTIAHMLLQINAVTLRPNHPFTWTSGIKSPIYCDNRLTMAYPQVRDFIAEGFVDLIHREWGQVDVVAGTATAGIPHAAFVSQKMFLPMAYIRSSAKGHGKENLIEGRIRAGQRVVVIEDLVSTGGSSVKAAQAVQEIGGIVAGVAAIFTYGFEKAAKTFAEAGIPLRTLTSYEVLLQVALANGSISETEVELLASWRKDPEHWEPTA
ncbi:orotate phosphoribosyltransferase [Effusibacillus lacus]|uniref:Orotate phosphoribosyltransferase n=1 Tax=Effusibacillus lacus TaxID=1348429 RepID=A0A292YPX4_9BACL|nr:orotate phosphoribosyltransferase [Effusibacillus lacus]TCS75639.1 orotate phosphoribosyltransferase [Effusibacillus lacus]GAX90961.1 orotate phosphoribosyltransferase [Effusibacillus lacus]